MKKNVLILAGGPDPYFVKLEEALISQGFKTLRVKEAREVSFRLENEFFSSLICEDDESGLKQRDLARHLSRNPFGATTPVVVIGHRSVPSDRSLLTSVLDQYFSQDVEPEMIAEFVDETLSLRSQKVKKGAIHSIPKMLCQAARFRFSGAVVMEKGEEKCVIYFEHGYIVFASSNQNAHRFGEFLISQNVIQRDQLDESLKTLRTSKKRLGRILVDSGYLKPQLLQTLLQGQIKHIVLNVFDWTEGEFYVLVEEPLDPENAIARAGVGPLLLEGVRYRFSEDQLAKYFEPFDSRVSLALPLEQLKKRVHLGKNEQDFLELVGEGRPIGELLNLNSYSRRESLGLLYSFRLLGFLAFETGKCPPPEIFPKKNEKKEVLEELFEKKDVSTPKNELPPSTNLVEPPPSRMPYVMGAASMVVAIAVFLTLFTFFDTRSSRNAQSDQRHMLPQKSVALDSDLVVISPIPLEPEEIPIAKKQPTPVPTEKALPKIALPKENVIPKATETPRVAAKSKGFEDHLRSARKKKEKGLLQDALKSYENAYALNWKHVEVLLEMADLYFELDETARAIRYYEKVKKLDPANPKPYLALGTIFLLQDEKEKAKRSYQAYLAVVDVNEKTRPRINEVRRILRTMGN